MKSTVCCGRKGEKVIKRILIIILTVGLILSIPLFSSVTFSSKYLEADFVILEDTATAQNKAYRPVNIMLLGKDLISDSPGIIVDGRTLVPLAFIMKELNIPFQWHGESKQITFDGRTGGVTLTIQDPYALIQGKRVLLPSGVAPRIMKYVDETGVATWRTYVPLAFVSEILGYDIDWIADTYTVAINEQQQRVTGVSLNIQSKLPEIRIDVTGKVQFNAFSIDGLEVDGQHKIIIDLQNTTMDLLTNSSTWRQEVPDGIFGLKTIDVVQEKGIPQKTRITITQNLKKGYHVHYDDDHRQLVITLANTLEDFEYRNVLGNDSLIFHTSNKLIYDTKIIDDYFVKVDLIYTYLNMPEGTYDVNQGPIRRVTFKQLTPSELEAAPEYGVGDPVVRAMIELNKPVDWNTVYTDYYKDQYHVFVMDQSYDKFEYVKASGSNSALLFASNGYDVVYDYDSSVRRLSFRVPASYASYPEFVETYNDNMIQQVIVHKKDGDYLVQVNLKENVSYHVAEAGGTQKITFENKQVELSPYRNTLVVIDAGHGGKDPGAVGSKIEEKVLALRASKNLERYLKEKGFKVYMTRSDDTFVGLYDRADIANELGADLFVSVHINAHTNHTAKGVEVFYGSDNGKRLAQSIQPRLVRYLDRVDRGVVHNSRLVVIRKTNMTAVLAELGFISNEEEQKRMMTDQYMLNAAKAMGEGIVEYIDRLK